MAHTKLGVRQSRFIDEYLVDCNATRAAIAAGNTKNTASQAGWEVLRIPKVAREIGRRHRLLSKRHEVSVDNVISELAKIGFSNAADFLTRSDNGRLGVDLAALADPMKAGSISQVELSETRDGQQIVKFKLFDKRAALSDLSRHLGLIADGPTNIAPASSLEETGIRELALATLALLTTAADQNVRASGLLIEGSSNDLSRASEQSEVVASTAVDGIQSALDDCDFEE